MAFKGVRSSWLMVARKKDFALLAVFGLGFFSLGLVALKLQLFDEVVLLRLEFDHVARRVSQLAGHKKKKCFQCDGQPGEGEENGLALGSTAYGNANGHDTRARHQDRHEIIHHKQAHRDDGHDEGNEVGSLQAGRPGPEQKKWKNPAHALHQFRSRHHANPVMLLALVALLVEEICAEIYLRGLAGQCCSQPKHHHKGRHPHEAGERQHQGKERHARGHAQLVAQEQGEQFELPRRFGGTFPNAVILERGALFGAHRALLVAVKVTAIKAHFRIDFARHHKS